MNWGVVGRRCWCIVDVKGDMRYLATMERKEFGERRASDERGSTRAARRMHVVGGAAVAGTRLGAVTSTAGARRCSTHSSRYSTYCSRRAAVYTSERTRSVAPMPTAPTPAAPMVDAPMAAAAALREGLLE